MAPLDEPAQQPFFDARTREAQYHGPKRDHPSPVGLTSIDIGWFGPSTFDHPTAGQMWMAVTLAIEEANARGGLGGKPYRLLPGWSENPWGTGIKDVSRLVYDEGTWAILGAPDGASAHLVEQIVAKARLPFISPVSTDKTANLANVPWVFSCAVDDGALAAVIADDLIAQTGGDAVAMLVCTDHDSRVFSNEAVRALRDRMCFPSLRLAFRPDAPDLAGQVQRLQQADPQATFLIAGPLQAARVIQAMKEGGIRAQVYGDARMGNRAFPASAGAAAEGVIFPVLWDASMATGASAGFPERFQSRFGVPPDYTAAHTHDAACLLIAALERAGLDQVALREAIRDTSPFLGVTGLVTWDPTGQNRREVHLGSYRHGQVVKVESPPR